MKKITRRRLENFLKEYASTQETLDLGAGRSMYQDLFPNRISLDIDPGAHPGVVADIHHLPFPNEKFPIIVCTEVLEHCHSPHQAIAEMRRVLKPEGRLILTTRFMFPLHEVPHDYFRYTKYGLRSLLRGMHIVDFRDETDTQTALAVLFQRLYSQTELFWGVRPFCRLMVVLLQNLPRLIVKEFGNRSRTRVEQNIMSSGYYVVAQNPLSAVANAG